MVTQMPVYSADFQENGPRSQVVRKNYYRSVKYSQQASDPLGLEVFLLPPGCDVSPSQGYPHH